MVSQYSNNKKPLWIEGEVLLEQKFFLHNRYLYSAVPLTIDHIIPTKILNEKFMINHTMNDSSGIGNKNEEYKQTDMKQKIKKNTKKKKEVELEVKFSTMIDNLGDLKYTNELDKRAAFLQTDPAETVVLKCLPPPGEGVVPILTLLEHFSGGLKDLFPGNIASSNLSKVVTESDQVYLMSKLYRVLAQLDAVLENQVATYMNSNDVDICLLANKGQVIKEIKKKYILNNFEANKTIASECNSESEMISLLKNNHFIEFIDTSKFACKACAEVFFTDPTFHIITPTHIQALSDIA